MLQSATCSTVITASALDKQHKLTILYAVIAKHWSSSATIFHSMSIMSRSTLIGQVLCTLLLLSCLELQSVRAGPRRFDPNDRRIFYVAAEPENAEMDWDSPVFLHSPYKRSHYMSQRLGK
ncbi:hypothetical protein FGIG_06273 [Fasciola gigantica]|uniref:Uncharacterized protein n=1 Tax=Fasciola gigantica TaxID=46835 RepID=A0A504YW22_FASGI|nr:hypothetical protein FGIG_06273 [Fasciola gigantica]